MPSQLVLLILLINSSLSLDLLSKFIQNDYKLKDFRTELESYDPTIVKYIKFTTFKYNRTTAALNFSASFLVDVKDKLGVMIQLYKFTSNEYRHFPTRFQVDFHRAFDTNAMGMQRIKNCGNIRSMNFLKGVDYYCCNFVPDERKFPPFIPNGQFKANIHYLLDNREIFVLNYFAEVYRPIGIPSN